MVEMLYIQVLNVSLQMQNKTLDWPTCVGSRVSHQKERVCIDCIFTYRTSGSQQLADTSFEK